MALEAGRTCSLGRGRTLKQLSQRDGRPAETPFRPTSELPIAAPSSARNQYTKELEAELSKLKRMYADLAMENDAIKALLEKKL